jgi:hypothetical protein
LKLIGESRKTLWFYYLISGKIILLSLVDVTLFDITFPSCLIKYFSIVLLLYCVKLIAQAKFKQSTKIVLLFLFYLQCGTLKVPSDKYHRHHQRRPSSSTVAYPTKGNQSHRMDESYTNRPNYHHYPDYAHSDGGSVTPPPSPSSSSSIVSLASNNSSASSSNDNISYYLLDTQQQTQQQKPQYKSSSSAPAGVTTQEKTEETAAADTEESLTNNFKCNLSLNGGTTPSDDEEDIVANHNRLKQKADEYEQTQQQLQQQQIDQQRLAVLSFEQVKKLNDVMNESVSIHGRGNFPTLEVRLKDFVTLVREKLELDIQEGGAGMCVKDIRLNGGAASHVLAYEAQCYNDLDLIFAVEFSSNRHFDRVKSAVLR